MNQQTQTSWIQASTGKNQEAIQFAKYTGYWSNQSDDVTELEGQDMGNVCVIKLNHLPQWDVNTLMFAVEKAKSRDKKHVI